MKLLYVMVLSVCSCVLYGEENAILASVNGEPVTNLDVVLETGRREMMISKRFEDKELLAQIERVRTSALESIIERKLIFSEYAKQPFAIPPQYIEDAMDELADAFSNGSRELLAEAAKKYGTTIKELRAKALEKVAVEILVNEYCRRPSVATPKQVFEYYQANHTKFRKLEEYKVLIIVLQKNGRYKDSFVEVVEKCHRHIINKSAADFKSAAMVFSEDASAEQGGDFGWIREGEMRDDFYEVLNPCYPGKVARLDADDAVFFFYLIDRKGGQLQEFKQVQQRVRLHMEREQRLIKYREYVDKLKNNAVIRRY